MSEYKIKIIVTQNSITKTKADIKIRSQKLERILVNYDIYIDNENKKERIGEELVEDGKREQIENKEENKEESNDFVSGTCCFCKEPCNPCSQSCGHCMRST